MFSSVAADEAERRAARQGDAVVARPDVVMDRAFTVAAAGLVGASPGGRRIMASAASR